jgi:hypothetical protein
MVGCADRHLGMKYQQVPIGKVGDDSIYCYRFGWGIDAMAYYISKKKDPCFGMNPEHDICLGKGESIIYFQMGRDTIHLYTNTKAPILQDFSGTIVISHFDNDSYRLMGELYKMHQFEKVVFDTVVFDPPCNLIYDSSSKAIRNVHLKDSL